jgi:beta-galactosidase beta subunit
MPTNPNEAVTRADLNQQLEIHAKTIELQVLLSKQQEEILDQLATCVEDHKKIRRALDTLERRTWKQGWLFWGMVFSLITTAATIISKAGP